MKGQGTKASSGLRKVPEAGISIHTKEHGSPMLPDEFMKSCSQRPIANILSNHTLKYLTWDEMNLCTCFPCESCTSAANISLPTSPSKQMLIHYSTLLLPLDSDKEALLGLLKESGCKEEIKSRNVQLF